MEPKYKFILRQDGNRIQASPIYGAGLSKKYAKERNGMYFRTTLDGKIKFIKEDFDFIMGCPFDSEIFLYIYVSYTAQEPEDLYFAGKFTRTDCTIRPDDKWLEVSLTPADAYAPLTAGLDKEFDIIPLAPEIQFVDATLRPTIQIYVPGDNIITNILGGINWESQCSSIDDISLLQTRYGFGNAVTQTVGGQQVRFCLRLLHDTNFEPASSVKLDVDDPFRTSVLYKKAAHITDEGAIKVVDGTVKTPTRWGIRQPGEYYAPPTLSEMQVPVPVGRNFWNSGSAWFDQLAPAILNFEGDYSKKYTLEHTYPLYSCIQVLLKQVAPDIKFGPTPEYSEFLYSDINPLGQGDDFRLNLVPKSNILKGDYDGPAQKMMMSLKKILDMLASVFHCFWFIDGDKLRIEHVRWFNSGRQYGNEGPSGLLDLTRLNQVRTGKSILYGTGLYSYEKSKLPERIQTKWPEDASIPFQGWPLEIQSNTVDKGNLKVEEVAGFVADVDFMLADAEAFSLDGCAVLAVSPKECLNNWPGPVNLTSSNKTNYVDFAYPGPDREMRMSMNLRGPGKFRVIAYIQNRPDLRVVLSEDLVVPDNGFYGTGFTIFFKTPPGPVLVEWISGTVEGSVTSVANLSAPYIPLVDIPIGTLGASIKVQNGLLAFPHLVPRYFVDDLPSGNVTMNGERLRVHSVIKTKKQELQIPAEYADIDPYLPVKTTLGVGRVNEVSVNLSSRTAKLTLVYDTE